MFPHTATTHGKPSWNNWFFRRISLQVILIGFTQLLTILVLSQHTDMLKVSSVKNAIAVTIIYSLSQWFFWYCFVQFIARVTPFLYPFLMFIVNGVFLMATTLLIPGFSITSISDSIFIVCILTATSTIAAVLFGMDDDAWFEFNIIQRIVKHYGKAEKSTEPGFIFFEIDGLSYDVLKKALDKNYMPTFKRFLSESHALTRWETDLSSQSGAMQAGILQGNNDDIPAFYWYDRTNKHIANSANPKDAMETEARLTNHHGLLEQGGASRGNMFSGDAAENLFTFSTVLDKKRKTTPQFYLFLLNPYIISRIITKFTLEVFFEIKDGLAQRIFDRQSPHVSRIFPYPFIRAFMNSLVPELVTYVGSIDISRGIPAMYLLYPGYDDLAHFSGIARKDSFGALSSIDVWLNRIERMVKQAPRPYHIIVLSDHGQSQGIYFKKKYGINLKELVESLIAKDINVYAALESNEEQYLVNSVLTDASNQDLQTSKLLKKSLQQFKDPNQNYINVSSKAPTHEIEKKINENNADLIVLASGCLGLIYSGKMKTRATYEQIEKLFPGLLQGLANHEGIGFVMVNSKEKGGIIIGKQGKYYLKTGTVEGINPLTPYGTYAAVHLNKENAYTNAPDILVNSSYDEINGEISGFEKQVGHHGGLGGYQTRPFLLYPKEFPLDKEKDIVGATNLHTILHSWRKTMQNLV